MTTLTVAGRKVEVWYPAERDLVENMARDGLSQEMQAEIPEVTIRVVEALE